MFLSEITDWARTLATLGGVAIDEQHEVYEYEDDQVKVVHQGEAVTLWRRGENYPILMVSSRGRCMHMDDGAEDAFDHVRETATRFRMNQSGDTP